MEIQEWATLILGGLSLEEKLFCPTELTDFDPQEPLFWKEPSRPHHLRFHKYSKNDKLPPFHEHSNQDKRALCLHRFAGHELLAVELMAYALLAFPHMPKHFRKGLANTLIEEQRHVILYRTRLNQMSMEFGDQPLNGRFWQLTPHLKTPLQYLCAVHLTLEMANLDFAPHYGASFARHGDTESMKLMQTIYEDELSHVGFGYHWLKKTKDENKNLFDTWIENLPPTLPPKRAKGFIFKEDSRKEAGLDDDWIERLTKI